MTHIPWNPTQAKVATKAAAFDRSTLTRLGLLGALGGGAAYGASQLGDMIPGMSGEGVETLQAPPTLPPELLDGANTGLENVPAPIPDLDMPAPADPNALSAGALPATVPEIDAGMQAPFVRGMPPVATQAWGNALVNRPVQFE